MFSFLFYVFYEYWQSWLWYIQGERSDLEEESSWFNRKILSGNIEAHESITQTGYRKGWRAALQILSLGPAWLLIPPAGLGTCHSAGHGENPPAFLCYGCSQIITQKAISNEGAQLGKLIRLLYSKEKQISSCNTGSQLSNLCVGYW